MKDARPAHKPKARTEKLVVKELPGETLVYDVQSDQAHCLNETASLVWKNCDGQKTVKEIAKVLGQPATVPCENVVRLALNQLESVKLLEQSSGVPQFPATNRRQLLRNLGVSAIALPLVISIVAPIAADAQTCRTGNNRPLGCPCENNPNCTSGCCTGSPEICSPAADCT